MTKNEKIIIAKWYITNKLVGIDTITYNKVKNNEIENLKELEDIIKNKGQSGIHLCLRCIHQTNIICNRCDDEDDLGFRFRYKYYQNRLIKEGLWNDLIKIN